MGVGSGNQEYYGSDGVAGLVHAVPYDYAVKKGWSMNGFRPKRNTGNTCAGRKKSSAATTKSLRRCSATSFYQKSLAEGLSDPGEEASSDADHGEAGARKTIFPGLRCILARVPDPIGFVKFFVVEKWMTNKAVMGAEPADKLEKHFEKCKSEENWKDLSQTRLLCTSSTRCYPWSKCETEGKEIPYGSNAPSCLNN